MTRIVASDAQPGGPSPYIIEPFLTLGSGSQNIWANLIDNISNFLPGCFCIISRGGLFALPYILVLRAWTSWTSTSVSSWEKFGRMELLPSSSMVVAR